MSLLLRHGAFPAAVHALVSEPVTLFKEKVNYKRAGGGGGYSPHQDGCQSFYICSKPRATVNATSIVVLGP
jgi:hypothetical protein